MSVVELGSYAGSNRASGRAAYRKTLRYEDVIALVERIAAEQALGPGDLLPSQKELGERAGVSLITVRRALEEMERAGRVRRHQGLGTFLARPRILSEPARTGGLLETLTAHPAAASAGSEATTARRAVGSTLLDLTAGTASTDIADALGRTAGAAVWQIRRLRHVDGRPLVLETAVVPRDRAPDLDSHVDDLGPSLYALLRSRYGISDAYEEQYLEVIGAVPEHRRHLQLAPRAQVVRIRGLSYDAGGAPFDCFEQVYPASDFLFAISGSTTRLLLHGSDTRDFTVTPASVDNPALPHTAAVRRARPRPRRRTPNSDAER